MRLRSQCLAVLLAVGLLYCVRQCSAAADPSGGTPRAPIPARSAGQGQDFAPREMTNSLGMPFVLIPGGQEFEMGARDGESGAEDDEQPRHRVRITRSFLLGQCEVTQDEFEQIMGFNPSYFSRSGWGIGEVWGKDTSRFPVECVTWYDALAFCNRLSHSEARRRYYELSGIRHDGDRIVEAAVKVLDSGGYRLPTEAEWECAARAGAVTIFPHGNTLSSRQANFDGGKPYGKVKRAKFLRRTAAVGTHPPNPWGLYDMAGNVDEWVWDAYDEKYYGQFAGRTAIDPTGPEQGRERVMRGGCWCSNGTWCRPAKRIGCTPDRPLVASSAGFRVALSQPD